MKESLPSFSSPHEERYGSLDGLRTLACIGIVLMHVRANNALQPTEGFWVTGVIGFAHDFVSLFMMLSAFGLCCGYCGRVWDKTSISQFYHKRYRRVLPFFAFLTLIDVVFCLASERFTLTDTLIGELWEAFANLTLVFGLIPGNGISVVGVGWFLGVIFLFYMLFPFFTFLIENRRRAWFSTLVSILLYLSVMLYFNPVKGVAFTNGSFMHCAPFFMVGGLLYLYRQQLAEAGDLFRWTLFGVTAAYTAWFYLFPEMRFALSNLLLYTLWVSGVICSASIKTGRSLLDNEVTSFLGGLSMEVYLCHMLVFRVVEKLHLEQWVTDPDLNYWLTCLLVLCGATCFAWGWKHLKTKYIK